jgi:hypothetical protein
MNGRPRQDSTSGCDVLVTGGRPAGSALARLPVEGGGLGADR